MRKGVKWRWIIIAFATALLCYNLYQVLNRYVTRSNPISVLTTHVSQLNNAGLSSKSSIVCQREESQNCQRLDNSRKFDEQCVPYPEVVYPVLITGLGGSGTHTVSKRLRDNGLYLPHETLGCDGSVVRMLRK
jgi:hypothetical protein